MRAPESQWMNSLTQACIHDYVHDIKIEIRILKDYSKISYFSKFYYDVSGTCGEIIFQKLELAIWSFLPQAILKF